MNRSNCLFFAVALYCCRCFGYRRRRKNGKLSAKKKVLHEGYLAIRQSRWGPFPHLLYGELRISGHMRIVSYVPHNPKHKPIPPPLFAGRIKWGDRTTTEGST